MGRTPQYFRPPSYSSKSRGFSLFELVVFIISVAIIYAAAARRFSEFPGEAERANFISVTAQLQTGINLETIYALTRGRAGMVSNLENANPMDFLLDTPSNYLGAFDVVDSDSIRRRSWYFDLPRRELVYLVNDDEGVYLIVGSRRVPTDEIRFTVTPRYRGDSSPGSAEESAQNNIAENRSANGPLSGLILEPVIPFEWESNVNELTGV